MRLQIRSLHLNPVRSCVPRVKTDGNLVRPAPAPVAPRPPPLCARRNIARYEIQPRRAPGLTARDSRQCHPGAGPQAEAADRFVGIFGTARQVPAARTEQWRQRVAVQRHQRAAGKPWYMGKTSRCRLPCAHSKIQNCKSSKVGNCSPFDQGPRLFYTRPDSRRLLKRSCSGPSCRSTLPRGRPRQ